MNLIVFDIDDTLTKSEKQHQSAFVDSMKHFGIHQINQNWRDYLHHTDSYILKENYENNLNTTFDFSFIQQFEKKMSDLILGLKPVTEIKGAKHFINNIIPTTNYAIAFATGSILEPAIMKLNQAGITFNKDLVVGSNSIFEREGIVSEAIKRAKKHYQTNEFEHIISVGDGLWDLKTASNLNIHFMGIGMKNLNDFKENNIQLHIEDWNQFNIDQFNLFY